MTTPMTAAQAAQQNNRTADGRYAEGSHADPGQVDLVQGPVDAIAATVRERFGVDPDIRLSGYGPQLRWVSQLEVAGRSRRVHGQVEFPDDGSFAYLLVTVSNSDTEVAATAMTRFDSPDAIDVDVALDVADRACRLSDRVRDRVVNPARERAAGHILSSMYVSVLDNGSTTVTFEGQVPSPIDLHLDGARVAAATVPSPVGRVYVDGAGTATVRHWLARTVHAATGGAAFDHDPSPDEVEQYLFGEDQ